MASFRFSSKCNFLENLNLAFYIRNIYILFTKIKNKYIIKRRISKINYQKRKLIAVLGMYKKIGILEIQKNTLEQS